jgi:hypothetical protein
MSEGGVGDLRNVLDKMIETAEFYGAFFDSKHTPTCWKFHTACALRRVVEILDGETEDDL